MVSRSLRVRCRKLVAALDLPVPFDLDEFCMRIGRQRSRSIRLLPLDLPPDGPCGLWIATRDVDYVFHHSGTSVLHQRHIVLHELGHILAGNSAVGASVDERVGRLLPDLDPRLVRGVFARTSYTDKDEREAETIATLIQARIRVDATGTGSVGSDLARRIERSLESRSGE
jgi:hypothetical protein